jgi:hypothetical protein
MGGLNWGDGVLWLESEEDARPSAKEPVFFLK